MNIICRLRALLAVILIAGACAAAQTPGASAEKIATVLGQNIHFFEGGQGPTVILLHGLGAVKEIWLGSIPALANSYHAYAIDQIGFGHSDKPLLDYRIATYTDFLYGFMQSQHIPKATLVGNSLGGWIALDFAARYPDMVDKLVLVDSAGIPFQGAGPVVNLNPSSLAGTRTLLEALFYDKKIVTDDFVQQVFVNHMRNNDAYTIQRTMAGFASENQFEDKKLASVRVPTLVVWGREDELLSLAYGEKLRDSIPGAKMVVFDQCGHVPQIEKPQEFNRAVVDFLGK